jgi:hypothetical protein
MNGSIKTPTEAALMARKRTKTVVGLMILGILLVGATGTAYRAIIERWEGDPRGSLIAAAVVGLVFFVSMLSMLSVSERRQRMNKSVDRSATISNGVDRPS